MSIYVAVEEKAISAIYCKKFAADCEAVKSGCKGEVLNEVKRG
ncbi:hypothetical protein [Photobacterium lutimaris]|nr:hypothetical protein [Photobacterium lutimaris]